MLYKLAGVIPQLLKKVGLVRSEPLLATMSIHRTAKIDAMEVSFADMAIVNVPSPDPGRGNADRLHVQFGPQAAEVFGAQIFDRRLDDGLVSAAIRRGMSPLRMALQKHATELDATFAKLDNELLAVFDHAALTAASLQGKSLAGSDDGSPPAARISAGGRPRLFSAE